jgi:Zn-dependent protease with chaperone function
MSATSATARAVKEEAEDVLQAIEGTIRRPRMSLVYLFGLSIVAIVMLALPIIYLAIIALVGYGVYYHAVYNAALLQGVGGARARLLLYVAPLVIGAILVVFMIKPLFARRSRVMPGLTLSAENEPVLAAYVAKLCKVVGAPVPREILVDCDVNASASFRKGFWSLFWSDLRLTIGLPLASGMTVRELTGVLAHEFGHFSQRLGMRFGYIIDSVNGWFARVVYERDTLDEKLEEATGSDGGWFRLVLLLARFFIWLTRRILWVLMYVGHAISCFMSRQMEFDADRYETLVAGSKSFGRAMYKLHALGACSQAAYAELHASWAQRRLVDNLPAFILHQSKHMPKEVKAEIKKVVEGGRTGWFDTHPCERDRIRRAETIGGEGIVRMDGPASKLFANFDAVCKATTLVHYRQVVDQNINEQNLVDTKAFKEEQERARQEGEELRQYLGHKLCAARPLLVGKSFIEEPADPAKTTETLRKVHATIARALPKVVEAYKQYREADKKLIEAAQAGVLCRAKIRFDASEFGLPGSDTAAIEEARAHAQGVMNRAGQVLANYESAFEKRMLLALQLLKVPAVARKIEGSKKMLDQAARVLNAMYALPSAFAGFGEARKDNACIHIAIAVFQRDPENESLNTTLMGRLSSLIEYMQETRREMSHVEYPFEHASGEVNLARYLLESMPSQEDFAALMAAASDFAENLLHLYIKCLRRLAHIAMQVEQVLGLKMPLIEAEEDDDLEGPSTADLSPE